MITFSNYYSNTKGTFKACKMPKREPDYISNSGSKYWYGSNSKGQYVIRYSDHWICRPLFNNGRRKDRFIDRECKRISSCQWRLKCMEAEYKKVSCGKIYLSDFKKISE